MMVHSLMVAHLCQLLLRLVPLPTSSFPKKKNAASARKAVATSGMTVGTKPSQISGISSLAMGQLSKFQVCSYSPIFKHRFTQGPSQRYLRQLIGNGAVASATCHANDLRRLLDIRHADMLALPSSLCHGGSCH